MYTLLQKRYFQRSTKQFPCRAAWNFTNIVKELRVNSCTSSLQSTELHWST